MLSAVFIYLASLPVVACPAIWPCVLHGKNVNVWNGMQMFQAIFFRYWHDRLLPFHTISSDLDLCWESQGQQKTEIVAYFSTERDGFWCGDGAV